MTDTLYPSNSNTYENNLDIMKPRYSEEILPVPWPFIIIIEIPLYSIKVMYYNILMVTAKTTTVR